MRVLRIFVKKLKESIFILLFSTACFAQQSYDVKKIGNSQFLPEAINDTGIVVGENILIMDVPVVLNPSILSLSDVNKTGQLAASVQGINSKSGLSESHAAIVLFEPNNIVISDLGTIPDGNASIAHAINNNGQVVGYAIDSSGNDIAFWYVDNIMVPLGLFSGTTSYAHDINDLNDIVGEFTIGDESRAFFRRENGEVVPLGALQNVASINRAINNKQQIVGSYSLSETQSHAFLYNVTASELIDIGTFGGPTSAAYDINIQGEVVGGATIIDASGAELERAFLFTESEGILNLNSLLPDGSPWILERATAINDNGVITGIGKLNDIPSTFLLTPYQQLFSYPHNKIIASDAYTGDNFSAAFALDNDTLVTTAPNNGNGVAYIHKLIGGTWVEQQQLVTDDGVVGDGFGVSVDLFENTMIIGANRATGIAKVTGAAYIFVYDGSKWIQSQKIFADDGTGNERFGSAVAVNSDTIVIGAPQDDDTGFFGGAAYLFTSANKKWQQYDKWTVPRAGYLTLFGSSIALDEKKLLISAAGVGNSGIYTSRAAGGAVHVAIRNGASWVLQEEKIATLLKRVGSISLDGDRVAVNVIRRQSGGTPIENSVIIFEFDGITWVKLTKLVSPSGDLYDGFGQSIALLGSRLVISAPNGGRDRITGTPVTIGSRVYIFDDNGLYWGLQKSLTPPMSESSKTFGGLVSLFEDQLLIGHSGDSEGFAGINSGSLTAYTLCTVDCQKRFSVDVSISLSAIPNTVSVLNPVTIDLIVANNDRVNTVEGVVVSNKIPDYSIYHPLSSSSLCHPKGPAMIECNVGRLPAGNTIPLEISFAAPAYTDVYSNSAEVVAIGSDPDLSNNVAAIDIQVGPLGLPNIIFELPIANQTKEILRDEPVMLKYKINNWVEAKGFKSSHLYLHGEEVFTDLSQSQDVNLGNLATGTYKVRIDLYDKTLAQTVVSEQLEFTIISLVPSVSILSVNNPSVYSPLEIEFVVDNWPIAENGRYIILYFDDRDPILHYSTDPIKVFNVDDGPHRVSLALANREGLIDVTFSKTIETTRLDPTIRFSAPAAGKNHIVGPTDSLIATVDIRNWITNDTTQRHFHWRLNSNVFLEGESATILLPSEILEPGLNQLSVVLVDDGESSTDYKNTIEFDVKKIPPIISIIEPTSEN